MLSPLPTLCKYAQQLGSHVLQMVEPQDGEGASCQLWTLLFCLYGEMQFFYVWIILPFVSFFFFIAAKHILITIPCNHLLSMDKQNLGIWRENQLTARPAPHTTEQSVCWRNETASLLLHGSRLLCLSAARLLQEGLGESLYEEKRYGEPKNCWDLFFVLVLRMKMMRYAPRVHSSTIYHR